MNFLGPFFKKKKKKRCPFWPTSIVALNLAQLLWLEWSDFQNLIKTVHFKGKHEQFYLIS